MVSMEARPSFADRLQLMKKGLAKNQEIVIPGTAAGVFIAGWIHFIAHYPQAILEIFVGASIFFAYGMSKGETP